MDYRSMALRVLVILQLISCILGQGITAKKATCVLTPDPAAEYTLTGTITFSQNMDTRAQCSDISITADISGFPGSGLHGFHVHEFGNITGGCSTTGGHFNPFNKEHGGPLDQERHAGDFGNINVPVTGVYQNTFTDSVATLFGTNTIIDHAMVVHKGVDDLGKGGNPESKTNGNAGPRLACCVIKNVDG